MFNPSEVLHHQLHFPKQSFRASQRGQLHWKSHPFDKISRPQVAKAVNPVVTFHCHGKWQCLEGKPSTKGLFSSAMLNSQRVNPVVAWLPDYFRFLLHKVQLGNAVELAESDPHQRDSSRKSLHPQKWVEDKSTVRSPGGVVTKWTCPMPSSITHGCHKISEQLSDIESFCNSTHGSWVKTNQNTLFFTIKSCKNCYRYSNIPHIHDDPLRLVCDRSHIGCARMVHFRNGRV